MKISSNATIDGEVSPWNDKFENWINNENLSIRKKILREQYKNKLKIKASKNNCANSFQKDYFLAIVKTPKNSSPRSNIRNRSHESESIIQKMKQRLKTINTEEGMFIQRSQKNLKMQKNTLPQSVKSSCKKNPILFNSCDSPQQCPERMIKNSQQTSINNIQNKLFKQQNYLFIKRSQHSLRSIQRLKSHKKLKLPKIQICTIDR